MRYLMFTADDQSPADLSSGELLVKMGRFMAEAAQTGEPIAADWQPQSQIARVRLAGGKVTVMDGPLTEVKRPASSCAMFEVDSLLEAVEWTASYLRVLGGGECEIRPI